MLAVLNLHKSRSHNRGRRPEACAISSIRALIRNRPFSALLVLGLSMIWDNFSSFRTSCAIPCGTRAYMLRGFLRIHVVRGNGVRNSQNFWCFWPTTQYIRSCLLEFCLSIVVVSCSSLSEVRQCRISVSYVPLYYITDQVVFRCFFLQEPHVTPL